MRAITGCFHTTPTSALEAETGLPPPNLRLLGKILQSITRIPTLPPQHPIHRWVAQARRGNQEYSYQSNLENLVKRYPEFTNHELEEIHPYIRPPWWTPNLHIRIDNTKEEAENHHRSLIEGTHDALLIYSDGSGYKKGIGTAAYSPTIEQVKAQYLGKETESYVYAAELEGIHMATVMARLNPTACCFIFVDSQAAIRATANPKRQSGQAIVKRILDMTDSIIKWNPQFSLSIEWIPGHQGIEGNERVDKEAKQAACGTTPRTAQNT